ncbi:hypothetical protein, partial [Roseomonas rosulenta]|uniref:hypothetical protein n=1 Tax=Roseomonas rosulenta TaxID=2748667 RepID=UPI0018DFC28A
RPPFRSPAPADRSRGEAAGQTESLRAAVAAAEQQRAQVAQQLDAMRAEVATAERRRAEIAGQIAATEARLNERRAELTDLESRVRRARDAQGSDPMSVTVPGPAPR